MPHYAGINTFLKAPYVENVRDAGKYDAAILGAPFDGGTDLSAGHPLWSASHPPDFGALHAL